MWDLPRPGLKPLSPALAGGFLTTAPPEKSWIFKLAFYSPCVCFQYLRTQFSIPYPPFSLTSWNLASLPIIGLTTPLQRSPIALSSISWHPDCSSSLSWASSFETALLVGFHDTIMQSCLYLIVSPFPISFFNLLAHSLWLFTKLVLINSALPYLCFLPHINSSTSNNLTMGII